MRQDAWRAVAVSGSVGVAWLVVVAMAAIVSLSPFNAVRGLVSAVFPVGVTPFMWSWPVGWAVLFSLVGAVAVALAHAALLRITGGAGRAGEWSRVWLTTVMAGAVVGMTVDVVLVFGTWFTQGWVMWGLDLGSRAAIGAYWGLLYGWIPAVIGARFAARSTDTAKGRPGGLVWLGAGAVVSLIVVGAVQVGGSEAAQVVARENAAAVEPGPVDGAAPVDPSAEGDPVPERVEGAGSADGDGCTPERSTLLLGGSDAATGHRVQSIRLMNFSEEPCIIEGYPDIAFGDQNGHELQVTIEHGRSFMAGDPGSSRIEVPAGGEAVAYLGWDAASTHGALVARTLFVAPLAGDLRGSWPVETDIVQGTTVSVTAWELDMPQTTDGGEE